MTAGHFDLGAAARREMIQDGFDPDFPPGTDEQIEAIKKARDEQRDPRAESGTRDLRHLLWSSIDNDTSRDLDQVEFAERVEQGIRVLVGIADVESVVPIGSPIDEHAARETTTVYTPVRVFPMLPEALSTDLTSLVEGSDRLAIVIEMVIASDGSIASSDIYPALIRNTAQLTYRAVGDWLEGRGAPDPKVAASADLAAQVKLQDEAATALRSQRFRLGALSFDRVEMEPQIHDGQVQDVRAAKKSRADDLIEDFMIAANEAMAKTLKNSGVSSIRRVVKSPERWPRIVELAARYGDHLPPQADSAALNDFLQKQRASDPIHYADLSLAVMKLMGPGEYVMSGPGDIKDGHFGLAATDYTHSTAPNRRFADLVTQRLIKSVISRNKAPYSDDELIAIARNCTLKEDAARKVERAMGKRAAALAFHHRIGQSFAAVVTGANAKGVFVRVLDPPVEGRLIRGESGADVGDQVRVTLINTDPERGYIDFAR